MSLKCETCGRFMQTKPGASWVFVPDSYVSQEENAHRCADCTKRIGPIKPHQHVVESLCCGVYKECHG